MLQNRYIVRDNTLGREPSATSIVENFTKLQLDNFENWDPNKSRLRIHRRYLEPIGIFFKNDPDDPYHEIMVAANVLHK